MPSLEFRHRAAKTAREYLGVPWKHQGRTRSGVDCVGLVIAVGTDMRIAPPDLEIPPYRREPEFDMLRYFDKYMTRVSTPALGSVVLFSFQGQPFHAGIVVNSSSPKGIVHSYASARKVVADYLHNAAKDRKVFRIYDYKELPHG